MNPKVSYAYWSPPANAEVTDLRKAITDLQNEVTRLRAAMPIENLREYDRRRAQA